MEQFKPMKQLHVNGRWLHYFFSVFRCFSNENGIFSTFYGNIMIILYKNYDFVTIYDHFTKNYDFVTKVYDFFTKVTIILRLCYEKLTINE